MWDTTLTTISPSLVSLFTLTKLPLACESFYIPRVSHVKSCGDADTTLNPSCGKEHNSKPDASRHLSQESNHGSDTICWEIKAILSLYQNTYNLSSDEGVNLISYVATPTNNSSTFFPITTMRKFTNYIVKTRETVTCRKIPSALGQAIELP
jgi:hypothetical protein